MTELQERIEELLFEGYSEAEIATKLNISQAEVEEQVCLLEEADVDPYEWDDGSADAEALASAGYGTDEDYGYCDY